MDESAEQKKSTGRRPRRRAGLGKGLGALIPPTEDDVTDSGSRPLDVLFPDLVGTSESVRRPSRADRGGSARNLLTPDRAGRIVSRETISSVNMDGGASVDEYATEEMGAQPATPTGGIDPSKKAQSPTRQSGAKKIVSRETIARRQSSSSPWGTESLPELQGVPGAQFAQIDPSWIIPNLKQPRQVFDPDELQELSASIQEVGVLQPIVVRPITEATLAEEGQEKRLRDAFETNPDARYELVMGERRWRATQVAGLDTVPAIIRTTEEDELLREALIENMHRVQLNPLEEAAAYTQLMDDFGYTQDELSKKIARSRPQIANTLRLLRLPPSVQRQVAAGVLSAGHARALLRLDNSADMDALAARIIAEGLSVRAAEEIVKFGSKPSSRRTARPKQTSPEAQRIADAVAGVLDTSVSVSGGAKKGRLVIEYADQDDLARIASLLGLGDDQM